MYPPDATAPQTPVASGAEPPAVVSLLAGHLDDTGYPATLLDLAARGWFRLAEPEPGRLMCLLPPHPPRLPLASYEERAALHLARRAAGRGEVPASALAEGFADGQVAFSETFHDEVVTDARNRGLIKPRLRGRTALLLAGAALIPAVLVAGAVHVTAHPGRAFLPVLCWLVLLWFIGLGLRGSERLTPAARLAWPAGSAGRQRCPGTAPGPRCPAWIPAQIPPLPGMIWRWCWTLPTVTGPSPTRPRWVPPPVRWRCSPAATLSSGPRMAGGGGSSWSAIQRNARGRPASHCRCSRA